MSGVFDGGVFDIGVFDVAAEAAGGVVLTATVSLIAGAASGQVPVVVEVDQGFGFRPQRQLRRVFNAQAKGDVVVARASILPGRASGAAVTRSIVRHAELTLIAGDVGVHVVTGGRVVAKTAVQIIPGEAKGFDAVKHDNDFFLMAA